MDQYDEEELLALDTSWDLIIVTNQIKIHLDLDINYIKGTNVKNVAEFVEGIVNNKTVELILNEKEDASLLYRRNKEQLFLKVTDSINVELPICRQLLAVLYQLADLQK